MDRPKTEIRLSPSLSLSLSLSLPLSLSRKHRAVSRRRLTGSLSDHPGKHSSRDVPRLNRPGAIGGRTERPWPSRLLRGSLRRPPQLAPGKRKNFRANIGLEQSPRIRRRTDEAGTVHGSGRSVVTVAVGRENTSPISGGIGAETMLCTGTAMRESAHPEEQVQTWV